MTTPSRTTNFFGSRLLVAGVARNCGKTLEEDIRRLGEALRGCKSVAWLVVESDSSDDTVGALRGLEAKMAGFRFVSLGTLTQRMPIRTERIAHCRNAYLEELRANPSYAEIDYVVVADLDGVNDLVTAEGIASCFTRADWDVCTANQRGPYYDIWALRHSTWCPNDCWREYRFLLAHNVQREVAVWASMYAKMITIAETEDWIEVDSAFGGLAIYRRSALEGANYVGIEEDGEAICEHVTLNRQVRLRGHRIFINPRLINTARTDQAHQRSVTQTLRRVWLDLRHKAKVKVLEALRPS